MELLITLITTITFAVISFAAADIVKPNLQTLKLVHALWRHGDRMPLVEMPSDPNHNIWPEPLEELTKMGMKQHYDLGRFIKKRYDGFFNNSYSSNEIYVRASWFNRTIASALANLAGMYPPSDSEKFVDTLNWKPIAVHTRQSHDENMLWMGCPCPTTMVELAKIQRSETVLNAMEKYKELIKFMSRKSGFKVDVLYDFHRIHDFLNSQLYHNDTNPWPDWMSNELWEQILELNDIEMASRFSTHTMHRLRGGVLIDDILTRLETKASGTLDPRLKYYIYSAHDTTMVSLMSALGAYNYRHPGYAAALFIELHQDPFTEEYTVQIFYRNDTANDEVFELTITSCGNPCKLKQLRKFVDDRNLIPEDWHLECGNKWPEVNPRTFLALQVSTGVFLALCVLLLLALVKIWRRLNEVRSINLSEVVVKS